MTVLGPATESCTYLLLAPTAALAAVTRRGWASRVAYALLAATVAAGLFPNDWQVQAFGPQPIAALLLLVVFVEESCRKPYGAITLTMANAA
jgi:hypothetical protein